MEPTPERIKELMDRHGYEEEEAEIWYHLREARNRLVKMYQEEGELEGAVFGGYPRMFAEAFLQGNVYPHINALAQLLERRVLARDHPDGWGSRPAPEEEEG